MDEAKPREVSLGPIDDPTQPLMLVHIGFVDAPDAPEFDTTETERAAAIDEE